jgi:mono/diheme cytochrome c family protein
MTRGILLLAVVAALSGSGAARAEPNGSVELGQQAFNRMGCVSCHSSRGEGGGGAGPPIARTPLPKAGFLAQLRHPRTGGMPPFSAKVLPDDQALAIWDYLQSIPAGSPASAIPLLGGSKPR